MAGYPVSNIDGIDEKYVCRLCLSLLREPVQLACGHRFCGACVINAKEKICDCIICGDNTMQSHVWRDRGFQRDMNSLIVYCQNCHWGGRYENYDNHLTENHSHRYDEIMSTHAENYGQTITNNLLEHHSASSHRNYSANLETVSFNSQLQVYNDLLDVSSATNDQIQTVTDDCGFMWKVLSSSLLKDQTTMTQLNLTTHGDYKIRLNLNVRGDATQHGRKCFEIQVLLLPGEFDSVLKWPYESQLTIGLFNVATHRIDYISSCQLCFQSPKLQNAASNENFSTQSLNSISMRLILDDQKFYIAEGLLHLKLLLCQKPLPTEILQEAMNVDHFKPGHAQIEAIRSLREKHVKSRQPTQL